MGTSSHSVSCCMDRKKLVSAGWNLPNTQECKASPSCQNCLHWPWRSAPQAHAKVCRESLCTFLLWLQMHKWFGNIHVYIYIYLSIILFFPVFFAVKYKWTALSHPEHEQVMVLWMLLTFRTSPSLHYFTEVRRMFVTSSKAFFQSSFLTAILVPLPLQPNRV